MKKIFLLVCLLAAFTLNIYAQITRGVAPITITSVNLNNTTFNSKMMQVVTTRNVCYNLAVNPSIDDVIVDAGSWGSSNLEYLVLVQAEDALGPTGTSYYAKIDTTGNIVWAFAVQSSSSQFEFRFSAICGSYITGVVTEGGYNEYAVILKLNANGTIATNFMYFDNDVNAAYTQLFSPRVISAPTGVYVVAAHHISNGNSGIAMFKIDPITGLVFYNYISDCVLNWQSPDGGIYEAKLLTSNVDIAVLTDAGNLMIINTANGPTNLISFTGGAYDDFEVTSSGVILAGGIISGLNTIASLNLSSGIATSFAWNKSYGNLQFRSILKLANGNFGISGAEISSGNPIALVFDPNIGATSWSKKSTIPNPIFSYPLFVVSGTTVNQKYSLFYSATNPSNNTVDFSLIELTNQGGLNGCFEATLNVNPVSANSPFTNATPIVYSATSISPKTIPAGTIVFGSVSVNKDIKCTGSSSVLAPTANFSASQTSISIGQNIAFSDLSTNTPTLWSWSATPSVGVIWSTSSSQNPTATFNASGCYTISLTATNASGSDIETKVCYINVSSGGLAPVADFSASTTNPNSGQVVNFTDISLNQPTSWSWSSNPSANVNWSNSSAQNPTATFNASGCYTIILNASNAFGSDIISKTCYINVSGGGAIYDTLSNWTSYSPSMYTVTGGWGYISGTNSYGDISKADVFSNNSPGWKIYGALINFERAYDAAPASTISIKAWNNQGINGSPGTVLANKTIPLSSIVNDVNANQLTFVQFSAPIAVNGPFYLGFGVPYNSDTLVVQTNTNGQINPGTAWEQWNDNSWHAYSETASWSLNLSNAIFPILINSQTELYETFDSESILVFPNPSSERINIMLRNRNDYSCKFELFDSSGQFIKKGEISSLRFASIDCSELNMGLYFLSIIDDNGIRFTKKFLMK